MEVGKSAISEEDQRMPSDDAPNSKLVRTDSSGQKWQFDARQSIWLPEVDSDLLEQQQAAYGAASSSTVANPSKVMQTKSCISHKVTKLGNTGIHKEEEGN